MIRQTNTNTPKKGMNRNSHPSEIANGEYTFALNANIQEGHGDGDLIVVNEPSNLKCSGFKEGYSVVKHKFDRVTNKTYFFLVNPITECSEIGFINMNFTLDPTQIVTKECNCTLSVVVEDGLENIIQEGVCVYNTIISDYCEELGTCTGCLGFSLNEPVTDVAIRHSISGDELYFTQIGKPQRYIKLDYINTYFQDKDECTGEILDVCLKCDDIRIFNLHSFPCLEANVIQLGGNLQSGIYEVAIAYSTIEGVEVTDYLAFTNYVSIIDYNNNILDQTSLDYRTSMGFSVDVSNLDLDYDFYKVVLIQRTGNNVEPIIIPYGIYSTSQTSFSVTSITSIQNGGAITMERLMKKRPTYLTANGLSDVGGYLFQHGLKQHREVNLQPMVSLLGSFVRWGTSKSLEKLYKDGVASSKYKTYPREEVMPLSIVFHEKGGYKTPNFIFVPRPPKASEIAEINKTDTNYLSVTAAKINCSDIDRDKFWQYYDTSEELGTCSGAGGAGVTETVEQTLDCIAEGHTITNGVITEDVPSGISKWIDDNRATIIASTNPDLADIKDALTNNSYYEECTPDFGDTCETPVLVSSKIVVTAVSGQDNKEVSEPQDKYSQVLPSGTCERLIEPTEPDVPVQDALPSGSVVNKKTTPTNSTCASASMLQNFTPGNAGAGFHLQDKASIGSKLSLLTSTPVTLTSAVFEPFLHSNAIYFQVQFLNATSTIVELSQAVCGLIDDNTSNSVRITVFDGCPVMTEKPAYGRILTDLTLATDPNRFMELNLADFTGNPYIVIDSPMRSDIEFDLTLTGSSGSSNINIGGINYTATFIADINTTINNFYTANSASWNGQGITSSVSGSTITMRMSEELYNSSVLSTVSGDLAFARNIIEEYHTLQPPCGCFAVYRRDVVYRTVVAYDSITFGKEYVYKSTCSFTVQKLDNCKPIPHKYGKFSYWESGLDYPCNDELYDSSKLEIKPTDITSTFRDEFEENYVVGGSTSPQFDVDGNYVLSAQANFMDKPIRHYKFPSNVRAPFMSGFASNSAADSLANNSIIYPIGFIIDNRVINDFLDIAVNNNYLTSEERENITGYEIFRGDRTTERSIVAKGLLFNTFKYNDKARNNKETHYQNYPLNDGTPVDLLNGFGFKNPNTIFTFQSPDTTYESPTLTYELGIDGYQKGNSYNSFAPYKGHPKLSILGRKAKVLAGSLAGVEVAAEALQWSATWLSTGAAGYMFGVVGTVVAAALVVTYVLAALFRFGKYRYEWLNTFEKLGTGFNHAYVGLAEGQYFNFAPNTIGTSTLRGLEISSYLDVGNKRITQETTGQRFFVNNFQREKSVFFKTQDAYPINYIGGLIDTSRMNMISTETGKIGTYTNPTFSAYGTMKQYIPNQYGEVNSVQWLSTGYCGNLTEFNDCDIIYGGDTYITRHSVVRKFPFFTETAYNQQFDTPFKYSSYFNINNGFKFNRGFIDFKTAEETFNAGTFVLPEVKTAFSLWDGSSWVTESSNNEFFIKDDNKFLINYFGIPYFLVESEINCWNRYAGVEDHEDYYPNVNDTIEWLQEDRFGIREKETFRYNRIFSSRVLQKPTHMLPVNYSKEVWDKQDDLSNAVIYSQKDSNSSESRSPWLNYLALDFYRFSNDFGKLIDVRGIESDQVLFRFTDGISVLGAVDQLRDRMTSSNSELGIGGIFTERSVNFNKTDLGHGGTQHKTIVSTPFGHYWADSKRGKVFELEPNAKGMNEVSLGMDKWFKEHLPFHILKVYPQVNIDRAYTGLGLSMGWDDRLKRVFLTKLDYIPKVNNLSYSEEEGFYINIEDPDGGKEEEVLLISLEDENYFEKAHWTVAYSPVTKTWISYYSFTPNYYNSYTDYFQTGVNSTSKSNGLWTHHALFNSYQVFYGDLHPFIIEESSKTNATSSLFESMEFYLQVRRYYNYYDFSPIFGKGFNKAYIYNSFQNSGQLNLTFEKYDDLSQWGEYPKHNVDSIDILQAEIDGRWSFNYIYNHVKDEKSGMPIWINDNAQINKELSSSAMDYSNSWKDRLRGDYFLNRLIQDEFSQYKMFYRIGIRNIDYYNG